jgi:hypothetical protein
MAQDQIRALLERAIDKLPEEFREILVARLIEEMSVEETSELFGVLPQTVKTRLFRARALLKAEMEKHIGPALRGTPSPSKVVAASSWPISYWRGSTSHDFREPFATQLHPIANAGRFAPVKRWRRVCVWQ